jgi:hypothetical protein
MASMAARMPFSIPAVDGTEYDRKESIRIHKNIRVLCSIYRFCGLKVISFTLYSVSKVHGKVFRRPRNLNLVTED